MLNLQQHKKRKLGRRQRPRPTPMGSSSSKSRMFSNPVDETLAWLNEAFRRQQEPRQRQQLHGGANAHGGCVSDANPGCLGKNEREKLPRPMSSNSTILISISRCRSRLPTPHQRAEYPRRQQAATSQLQPLSCPEFVSTKQCPSFPAFSGTTYIHSHHPLLSGSRVMGYCI